MTSNGHPLTLEELKGIVQSNDKKRFAFSEDLSKIRANQGHSVEVNLLLKQQIPPDLLYHGTAEKNIESIKRQGLLKGAGIMFTYLLISTQPGRLVPYGKPVVLTIDAKAMSDEGCTFFQSENGVWLTEYVLAKYINFH